MQERGKIGKLLIFIEARHLTVIIRRCRMQLLVCFHQVAVAKKEKIEGGGLRWAVKTPAPLHPLPLPFPLRLHCWRQC